MEIVKSFDKNQVHIGWINITYPKGFGFIVDFDDNKQYFFHNSQIENLPLIDRVIAFKIRKSSKYTDKYEAYGIQHPFYYKNEIVDNFENFSINTQTILGLYIPSMLYSLNDSLTFKLHELKKRYNLLMTDLKNYVDSFDIEDFLSTYSIKIRKYYSASTRDWDINSLDYISVIGEPYCNKKSVYLNCPNYEENLVWEYFQKNWACYREFDPYIMLISSKSHEIISTTAYGQVYLWDEVDKKKVENDIPKILENWKNDIRTSYNKEAHFNKLIEPLRIRFNKIIDKMPFFINKDGEETSYICTPHFNLSLKFPNAEVLFSTTSYANAKGYGYEFTYFSNGRRNNYFEIRDGQTIDTDFIALKNQIFKLKKELKDSFINIITFTT